MEERREGRSSRLVIRLSIHLLRLTFHGYCSTAQSSEPRHHRPRA